MVSNTFGSSRQCVLIFPSWMRKTRQKNCCNSNRWPGTVPPSHPSSFWKGDSLWGLCMFAQSCVKNYIKALLPKYYLNTSYNNIFKVPVNREGVQPAICHTANMQGSWALDWGLCLQCTRTFHPTSLLLSLESSGCCPGLRRC